MTISTQAATKVTPPKFHCDGLYVVSLIAPDGRTAAVNNQLLSKDRANDLEGSRIQGYTYRLKLHRDSL